MRNRSIVSVSPRTSKSIHHRFDALNVRCHKAGTTNAKVVVDLWESGALTEHELDYEGAATSIWSTLPGYITPDGTGGCYTSDVQFARFADMRQIAAAGGSFILLASYIRAIQSGTAEYHMVMGAAAVQHAGGFTFGHTTANPSLSSVRTSPRSGSTASQTRNDTIGAKASVVFHFDASAWPGAGNISRNVIWSGDISTLATGSDAYTAAQLQADFNEISSGGTFPIAFDLFGDKGTGGAWSNLVKELLHKSSI